MNNTVAVIGLGSVAIVGGLLLINRRFEKVEDGAANVVDGLIGTVTGAVERIGAGRLSAPSGTDRVADALKKDGVTIGERLALWLADPRNQ